MPDDFDPYHQWLGISAKYQPPTHYRLLGLELFESSPDVIATAADQRMAHVRSFQGGPRAALSQKILNELSAARLTLLSSQAKRDYDADLRSRLMAERAATGPDPEAGGERWAQDLADDVKAASRFAAKQTERLRIAQFKLPEAYRRLGADLFADRRFEEDLRHFYPEILLAEGRVREMQEERPSWVQLPSKLKNRAQLEAAQLRLNAALASLGRAAYNLHGAASGPPDLVAGVEELEERVARLDGELARLEASRARRWIGPKWIAAAGVTLALLVALSIARSLVEPVLLICALGAAGYVAFRYWIKKK